MDTAEVYSSAVPPTTTTAFLQLPWVQLSRYYWCWNANSLWI